MPSFNDFKANLMKSLDDLIAKNYSDFTNAAKKDAISFLDEVNSDLVKWTGMLANGQIDKDEFESLVESDKLLIEMHALKQAGLAEARFDNFINSVVETTISTAVKTFL